MNIYLFTVLVAILLFAFVIIVQSIIDYLKNKVMYNTKVGNKVHKIRNHEILTIGSREGNFTSQKHFQVDYPKDLN